MLRIRSFWHLRPFLLIIVVSGCVGCFKPDAVLTKSEVDELRHPTRSPMPANAFDPHPKAAGAKYGLPTDPN